MEGESATARVRPAPWIGLVCGPLAAVLVYSLLPEVGFTQSGEQFGLTQGGRATAAIAILMATWWLTEAIPLSATALLPIALFPLAGVMGVRDTTAPYAHPLIFLFMGGFILGLAMERWGLHRRIALRTILLVGTRPRRVVGGFMLATALLSMWVSNTATTIMMLPIAISVVGLVRAHLETDGRPDPRVTSFATALMLGIAYAASIGGVGTLIGTPPNTVLAAYASDKLGIEITMGRWMLLGLPLVVVFLPLTWLFLTRVAFRFRFDDLPGGRELIAGEVRDLGRTSRAEWTVLAVFSTTACLWVFRAKLVSFGAAHEIAFLAELSDAGIAMAAALCLFLIPVSVREHRFIMDWKTAQRLPWGILLLFGGGLTLARAMTANGVDKFIGDQFGELGGVPSIVLLLTVVAVVIFLTEITSNTAVTNTLMPVLAAVAVGLGVEPMSLLAPAAIAASCAFMLPVATPPNAIVFGSGHVTITQMARAGLWLNVLAIVLVTLLVYLLAGVALGS